MKKILKSLAVFLIITCCIIPSVCTYANATSTADKTYYTDLFWGYGSVYLQNAAVNQNYSSLKAYSDETGDLIFDIYNAYIDESPKFKWTVISSSLKAALDLSEWVKIVSDANLGTDFTYDSALKKAAMEFAESTMSGGMFNDTLETAGGAPEKIADGLKDVFGFFEDLDEHYDVSKLTESKIYTVAFEALKESKLLKHVKTSDVNKILNKVLEDPGKYAKYANVASHSFYAAEAIIIGLMLEDVRLDIITNIRNELPSDSPMRRGLDMFISSIDGGFFDYFYHTYMTEKFLKEIGEQVIKKLTTVVLGDFVSLYSVVKACFKVLSWVAFDVIFDVPSLDELTLQFAMWTFTNEIYSLINKKFTQFDQSFTNSDVREFEVLVDAFFGMTYATLEASAKLTIDTNSVHLEVVTGKAKNANYALYVYNAIHDINSTPKADRVTKKLDYVCTNGTKFSEASDTVSENTIYEFDGYIRGNLSILGDTTMLIEENKTLNVDGNISVGLERFSGNYYYDYYATLQNDGTIVCLGDFKVNFVGPNYGKYVQSNENAKLIVKGDVNFGSNYYTYTNAITSGEVILSGNEQQTLTGFSAHNVTVTNPEGVKYAADVRITGRFELNGLPLDCGNYYTVFYSTTAFDSDSDYKNLLVGGGTVRIKDNKSVKGNVYVLSDNSLIIEEARTFCIEGSVTLGKKYEGELYSYASYATLQNNGTLVCTGNLKTWTGSSNEGKFVQENPDAKLYIGGDIDFSKNYYNQTAIITSGEVIFCGTEQQTLTGFVAYNVTVTNPYGIKYDSHAEIKGHFDLLENPLDVGEYYTAVYTGTTFANGSDYKELRLGESTVHLSGKVKGNITTLGTNSLTVDKGCTLIIEGNITIGQKYNGEMYSYPVYSELKNNGMLICTGDLTVWGNGYNCGRYIQNDTKAQLYIEGNMDFGHYSNQTCKITDGEVVFNGIKSQTVNGFTAHNVTVTNMQGIKYVSDTRITGHFDLRGNPLDCGNYCTAIYSTTTFAKGSDYKELRLGESTVHLSGKVKGNITTLGTNSLTVDKGCTFIIEGNITIGQKYNGEMYSYPVYSELKNNGVLICTGDLTVWGNGYNCGRYIQNDPKTQLYIEGNMDFGYYSSQTCKITDGEVIFSGSKLQTIYSLSAPIIKIENTSSEGVVFTSAISPSVLFDHNRNNYTLYNNGIGSTFVDYDGDGQKDNIDPYPASVYNNGVYGDVNSDNEFSNADIALVIRLLSGWGMDDIPEHMADADANRKCNNRDIMALIRKLAGWDS